MSSETSPSRFAKAEGVTRRLLLQVGLGFLAMVVGTVISGTLVSAVWQTMHGSANTWPLVLAQLLGARMWVWLVLPALAYAAARVVPLKPWPTAGVAVATGELFSLSLRLIVYGFEGLYQWESLLWLVTSALGLWLTSRAIEKSRQAVAVSGARAAAKAEAAQVEYEHFKKEAARLAEKREEPPGGGS
ncbi:MAG: hypothetical protein K1X64_22770 [Myxococcaceae bacterium]|nr:hypothetical protein [Myxococcaceae bacterium]